MKKLNKLLEKYFVSSRTELISAISNSINKSSTKTKELRIVKNESKNMPKILKKIEVNLKHYNELSRNNAKLRKVLKKRHKVDKIKEVRKDIECTKLMRGFQKIQNPYEKWNTSPDPYRLGVLHNEYIKVQLNIKNNSGTNDFVFSLDNICYEWDRTKNNLEKVKVLNEYFHNTIIKNIGHYKAESQQIYLTSVDGWFGGVMG